MLVPVTFYCHDCEFFNRTMLGAQGFVTRQYEFDSVTDVWQHLTENPRHHITAAADVSKGETDD